MSKPDYGPMDRALHRLALGPRFVRHAAFDIEGVLAKSADLPAVEKPVFIAGLARSGSTILLNALYGSGVFRSLTYRDMPFVMMPGLWKSLSSSSRTDSNARERAHGDGLMVEYDSPEALEEVFWQTFCGEKYVRADEVVPHKPAKSICASFNTYIQYILASSDDAAHTRYLSKNNNNLLRLPALRQACPDAIIIIPFRSPLSQARSLQKQHELFTQMHAVDRFSMQYMNWLGHYEFGQGHKTYAFADTPNPYQAEDVNYWLQTWLDAHEHALASAPPGTIFLSYEKLCQNAVQEFGALYPKLGLSTGAAEAAAFYKTADEPEPPRVEPELGAKCESVYAQLVQRHSES